MSHATGHLIKRSVEQKLDQPNAEGLAAPLGIMRPLPGELESPTSDRPRLAKPLRGVMGANRTLSLVLKELPEDRSVSLGELLSQVGTGVHGFALLLLSVPEALPLPLPSLSAILGVPLIIISAHLAWFGEESRLPSSVRDRILPTWLLGFLRTRVAHVLARAERHAHPRWQRLAGRDQSLGFVCLYLSILLLLPIPFFNVPPALCLALLAWGMVQRDGLAVIAGLVGTVIVTAALVGLFGWARSLLR